MWATGCRRRPADEGYLVPLWEEFPLVPCVFCEAQGGALQSAMKHVNVMKCSFDSKLSIRVEADCGFPRGPLE